MCVLKLSICTNLFKFPSQVELTSLTFVSTSYYLTSQGLMRALSLLKEDYGSIYVNIANPLSLHDFCQQQGISRIPHGLAPRLAACHSFKSYIYITHSRHQSSSPSLYFDHLHYTLITHSLTYHIIMWLSPHSICMCLHTSIFIIVVIELLMFHLALCMPFITFTHSFVLSSSLQ